MAADSSKNIYFSQMEEYSNQEKNSFMCAFNIIYFLCKSFVLNNFFFSLFSVFERFKEEEEDKIRIKISCSTLIVPFHVLPITIFHTFFFSK